MRNHALAHSFTENYEQEKRKIRYEITLFSRLLPLISLPFPPQLLEKKIENQPLIVTMEIVFFRFYVSLLFYYIL